LNAQLKLRSDMAVRTAMLGYAYSVERRNTRSPLHLSGTRWRGSADVRAQFAVDGSLLRTLA